MTPRESLRTKYEQDLETLQQLEDYLNESCSICAQLDVNALSRKHLREIGAPTVRFQRAQDFFISHILRTVDALTGESGTTLDVLDRAEQRGIISSTSDFLDRRSLRNRIAHEYAGYGPMDIVQDILRYSPILLDAVSKARSFHIPE